MRNVIGRALFRVLDLFFRTRQRSPGRHTAQFFQHADTQPQPTPVRAWSKPWPGPNASAARAVFRADEAVSLDLARRERFYAAAWAERGYDYPHAAPGVDQVRPGVPHDQ